MKIGMATLVELKDFEANLKLCQSLGLDFVEVNMNLPMFGTCMDVSGMKKLLANYQLGITLHVAERIDVCELDPVIRKGYLDAMIHTLKIANELKAFKVNMHMSEGIYFKLPDKKVFLYNTFKDDYMSHLQTFLEVVTEHIGDTILCIENTGILHHDFVKEGCDILLKHNQIFLTYDIGHDITSGYKDREYYFEKDHKIQHYHIHDGTDTKNHLTLFTGDLDIHHFMNEVDNKSCSAVIEVKSQKHLETSIQALRSKKLI